MRKAIMCGTIIAGLLISASVRAIVDRVSEAVQGREKYDLIIEDALDQIEKSIDPAVVHSELAIEPVLFETPDVEINQNMPTELELDVLEDVVEIGEIDLNALLDEDPIEEEIPEEVVALEEAEPQGAIEVKVIPLLHAEASSLIDALGQMKSPDGEVSYNEADRTIVLKDVPGQIEAMSAFIKKIDILLETGIFALEYVQAADIAASIEAALTEDIGQAEFDEEANSIVVTDTPVKIGKIKKLIRKLDLFNVEVSIASRILKIVLNDEHPVGVDWEAIVSAYQELALFEGGEEDVKQLGLGTVSQEDYDILLEALDTVGAVRTVAQDDIRTENEATGTISSRMSLSRGKEVQFYLTPSIKKEEPLEVGITMKEADEDNVTVQMKNGETIVIGGLFENVMVASTWKIPLLGDLPLLGFVFRNEGEESRKAETITFLTVKAAEKKKL